jgi:hypothetical protein
MVLGSAILGMTGLAQLGSFLRTLYYGALVLLAVNLIVSVLLRTKWSVWYSAFALASVIAVGIWAQAATMPNAAAALFYPGLAGPIHFLVLMILATTSYVRRRRTRRTAAAGMPTLSTERSFDAP